MRSASSRTEEVEEGEVVAWRWNSSALLLFEPSLSEGPEPEEAGLLPPLLLFRRRRRR